MEPEKNDSFIVRMFRKALELEMDLENLDFMSPSSFCELALKENLGGYGKNQFEEIVIADELMEIAMKKVGKKGGAKKATLLGLVSS